MKYIRLFGVFVILFALYLIVLNIWDYFYLPSRWEPTFEFVSLFKYKEDVGKGIYEGLVLLCAGLGTFIRRPVGRITIQVIPIFILLDFVCCFLFLCTLSAVLLAILTGGIIVGFICCMYTKRVKEFYQLKPDKMILYYSFMIILLVLAFGVECI